MHVSRHPRPMAPCILLAAALLMLPGCKGGTSIKSLLDEPGRYDGKEVRIAGAVTHSIGVLGTGAYQIDDGTGKIIVITKTGAPREGARVGVEGTFRSAFTFQTETAAVVVETDRRTR